jgi:mannosidase alpha-like ER degradation enhancer 2
MEDKSMRKLLSGFLVAIFLMIGCGQTVVEQEAVLPIDDSMAIAQEVKAEFSHAWNAYKEFAWSHDELKPLSGGFSDWSSSTLLLTPIDALDTLYLMGMEDEAEATLEYIKANLSFDIDGPLKHFEVVIRVLGGLISAYQFSGDEEILALAVVLADRMLPVFDSPTGMPYTHINLTTGEVGGVASNPAEIGTVQLEYGMISKLTGDPIYWDTARKAVVELFDRRSELGLVGTVIDVESGEWLNSESHIGGMIDSYYEYLYKCGELFDDDELKQIYRLSMEAVLEHLLVENENGTWFRQVDMHSGETTATSWTALGAFMPGLLTATGQLELAEKLQTSSFAIWQKHGIEPESVDYISGEVLSAAYFLRPEIMESAWYLYVATGEPKYQEMNSAMFESIRHHCRVENGYAALSSVITKKKSDRMESFFLAETLKYLYLTFDAEANGKCAEAVFNTEAHPYFKTW